MKRLSMRVVAPGAVFALITLGGAPSAVAQDSTTTLHGIIVDSVEQRPVDDVDIFVEGTTIGDATDSLGAFVLPGLRLGSHQFSLYKAGFVPRSFRFVLTEEHMGEVDLGMLGIAPIPRHRITVHGSVRDVLTGEVKKGVLVTLNGEYEAVTDEMGRFQLVDREVLEGFSSVDVRHIGYEAFDYQFRVTEASTDIPVDVRLQPLAVKLNEIVVEGRAVQSKLSGFFRRRGYEHGEFLAPWEINALEARETTDYLRTIRGVLVPPTGFGSRVRLARGCRIAPKLFLDGVEIPRGGDDIDNVVAASDVDAIEVYSSPSRIPSQFVRRGPGCGVVVIWTKTGG